MPRNIFPEDYVPGPDVLARAQAEERINREASERAFLRRLFQNPAAMVDYMGDPYLDSYFFNASHWLVFKVMEVLFIQQGTIELDQVIEQLAEHNCLGLVGGADYLELIEGTR